jgi:hypothetical protein
MLSCPQERNTVAYDCFVRNHFVCHPKHLTLAGAQSTSVSSVKSKLVMRHTLIDLFEKWESLTRSDAQSVMWNSPTTCTNGVRYALPDMQNQNKRGCRVSVNCFSRVRPANTLTNEKCSLLSHFRGTDQTKCIVSQCYLISSRWAHIGKRRDLCEFPTEVWMFYVALLLPLLHECLSNFQRRLRKTP